MRTFISPPLRWQELLLRNQRCGFTPQKPIKRAYEQSSQAVQQWLKTDYPLIAKQAKKEKAEIYWGDETGIQTGVNLARGYALKGEKLVVQLVAKKCQVSGVHPSKIVKQWLEDHRKQIEVFYLPSYSPDLNPDEYLNGNLKTVVHSGEPIRDPKDLASKTYSFRKTLVKKPAHVCNCFKHPKVAYAA